MDSENLEAFYREDYVEYRVYSDVCDILCIERIYKNHLKSQTQTDSIRNKVCINKYELLMWSLW